MYSSHKPQQNISNCTLWLIEREKNNNLFPMWKYLAIQLMLLTLLYYDM